MKSLYLLVFLLPLIGAITRTYQNCHRLEWAKEAKIYWTFDHAQNIAHIGMEAIAQDFLAVSFSKEGTIISGTEDFLDGWMVYVDNGECLEGCLWDTYTPPDGQPIKDLNNDLSDVLISKQGDLLVAEFSRRIDTGDKNDHPLRPFGSQFVFWSTVPKSSIQANLEEIPIVYDGSLLVHFDIQSSCEEMVHQKRRANTYTSPDGIWTGSWQVDATQTYIDVTMTGKTTGWISFCFSNIGKMTVMNPGDNTDCYTGWVNGTTVVLNDEQSVSYLQPKLDTANGGTNDATNVAGSFVNGATTISFRRKLKTADALDIVITNTNMYLSWGYGPAQGNAQGVYPIHSFTGAQFTAVNFFGGAVPTMATSASAPPAAANGNTFTSPKGNFKLTWAIDLKAAMVTFTMTGTVNGWIGLGYGPQPLMKNQDMIAGWIDDNTMKTTLLDSYSLDYLQPRDDVTRGGTYDVTLVSSTQAGGSTTIAYKRKLVTGDANDQDITNTMMYLTWGISPADGNANGQYGIHSDYGAASVNFFTGAVAATPTRVITSGQILLIVVGGILAVWIIIRMLHKCIKAIKRKKAKRDNNYTVQPVTFVQPINLGNGLPTPNPSYGGSSSGSSSGSNSSNSPMLESRQPSTNYPQMNSPQPYGSGPIQDNHSTRAIPRQPGDPSPNPKFRPAPVPGGRRALPSRPGMGPAPPRPYMSPPLPVQNNTFTGAYFRGSEIVYPKHIQDKTMRRTMKEMKKIEIVKDNTQMQIDANIIDEKGSGNAVSRFFKSIYEARVPRTQLTFGYLLVVILYIGINVACSFYDPQLYVAVGSLAGANGLLVALPATRNSIFVWLLGIPFDKTILYHRWLGRFTIFLVLLHMILSFVSAGGIAAIASMSARTVIIFGYVSFAASVILFVTSLEYFRRNKYEMFHFTHYFFFIFYIFGAVHETEMLIYSVIALGIYVLDKLIRIFWGSFPMKTTELRYKEGDIIQVRFGKHMMARLFGLHKVGQYMFVNFPTISPLEWHPYSVSSGPDEKTVEIHIKALGDHTRKLVNSARGKQSMWVRTDGPYGNHKINYRRFPVLILAAGGIGVTPCMGILKDVFRFGDLDRRAKPRHVSLVQKVYFVWVVQNMEQFGWFSEEIQWCNEASKKGNGLPDLEIQIYVTKSDGELNGFFKKGRPDMFGIFDKIVRSHDDKASTVFTCGPRKLVNSCWDATSEQRRGGATIHFHHETFEF